jgi:hypothetical protein
MGARAGESVTPDVADYCRKLETYLCQKNEGHLIRIVGPAFEQVSGWAARGVPLTVACRGIDRYCERYYAKGPRRRPVRIEFCEADILELFDDWRRAIGVAAGEGAGPQTRKPGLASHLERVIARLTALRAGQRFSPVCQDQIDGAVRELDRLSADANARGERRAALLGQLEAIDRRLMDAAAGELTPASAEELRREAADELAPFAARMTVEARQAAIAAAFTRLVREAFGIPTIRFE